MDHLAVVNIGVLAGYISVHLKREVAMRDDEYLARLWYHFQQTPMLPVVRAGREQVPGRDRKLVNICKDFSQWEGTHMFMYEGKEGDSRTNCAEHVGDRVLGDFRPWTSPSMPAGNLAGILWKVDEDKFAEFVRKLEHVGYCLEMESRKP